MPFFWIWNQNCARKLMRVWSSRSSNPAVFEYMFRRNETRWQGNEMIYGNVGILTIAWSLTVFTTLKFIFVHPQLTWHSNEKRLPAQDQHFFGAYVQPWTNNKVRSYFSRYLASIIDTEPDWMGSHPWRVRPDRVLGFKRVAGVWSIPRYFDDQENFEDNLHTNVERMYEERGTYKSVKDRQAERSFGPMA
eukprot:GHVN01073655.1.p1 GENE.GHVN01073655.1~~GHVN01073655.1.p1  ORF type:complete len:191 (+),score=7.61 GHVN01073655.1:83-655(+)